MAGVPFCGCCIYLVLCLCPAQSGPTELYISTDPDGLGPLYQPHSLNLQQQDGRGTFQEVQSLKKKKKDKKKLQKKQENGKRLPFRTCSPAAHKQKSLLPVSVTALIQAQTDPIAEDLPASCTNWRTLTVKGVSHAAPASRGSPLYSSVLDSSIYVYTTYIYTVSTVCGITSSDFLDRNL